MEEKIQKKEVEISPIFELSNEHRKSQEAIQDSRLKKDAIKWAAPKEYAKEHLADFTTSLVMLIICVISAIFFGHYTILSFIDSSKDSISYFAVKIGSIILIGLIYWLEFVNLTQMARATIFNKTFIQQINIGSMRWIQAVFISALNIAIVTGGVYFQSIENDTTIKTVIAVKTKDSTKIASESDNEIKRIESQIYIINENSKRLWKGQKVGYTSQDKTLLDQYEKRLNAIHDSKKSEIATISAKNEIVLTETKQSLFNMIILKLLAALLIETIILFCIFTIGKYRTNIYLENEQEKIGKKLDVPINTNRQTSSQINYGGADPDQKKK